MISERLSDLDLFDNNKNIDNKVPPELVNPWELPIIVKIAFVLNFEIVLSIFLFFDLSPIVSIIKSLPNNQS